MISFELALRDQSHARIVMDWRNDAQTRAMSFHREAKEWDAFWPEFAGAYFRHPELPPLFALEGGERVAFLRFTPTAHPTDHGRRCCDVGINVAPSKRGRGVGSAALAAVQPLLARQGFDDVLAEVRVENDASRRVFEKAGFTALGEGEHLVEDSGERCRVVRYLARLATGFFTDDRVFIIAEAGSNWRMGTPARDRQMARMLIDVAADAGADAVKFQTYRPETVYVANAGSSDYLSEAGIKEDISEIFADLAMPYEMLPELAEYCAKRNVQFMSTPFSVADFEAVDPFVRVHKCASYENSHLRLLERFARAGKPLVMSTGASTEADVAWAVDTFRDSGGRDLCLLQCTARYPAPIDSLNLATIPWLKRRFATMVGLSDHSRHPVHGPLAAVALGARVIEKHYTLDRRLPGPDHAFAITPEELKLLVEAVRAA
ncbi:MAG: Uncharacterized protein JWM53_6796, partial [bacterium]|nr:Uncharacterized protein [bacterium]